VKTHLLHGAILATIAYVPLTYAATNDPIPEIIVTGDFRDADMMDSTDSVTVVDEIVLKERSAQHLESVLNVSPNVNYASGASRARFIQVRGIGDLEQFVDPKHFPSVGISVDEINLGGTANAGMLFDAQQVEIIRGPQGTRFGTSALAGMVNIISNQPTDEFEHYIRTGVGNYNAWHLGGVVSGPLTDYTKARLAIQQNKGDGYIDNTFLGRDDTNGYDELSVRAKLRFDPTANSTYELMAFHFNGENGYDAFSLSNDRNTLSDQPGHDNQDTDALAAKGEWHMDSDTSIQAVATWLQSDLEYGYDEDWTFVGICDGTLCDPVWDFYSNTDNYKRDRDEVSLDVRILGDSAARTLRYVVGAYLQQRDEDLHREYYGDFFSGYETDRRAIYGQLEASLSDQWTLLAGARLERFDDDYSDTFGFSSDSDDSLWSGELTLSYETNLGTLLYATLSRGNKAGAINTQASANLAFMQPMFQTFMQGKLRVDTEVLISTEVGIKGHFMDDDLRFRAAVFSIDRDDAQLESWMWDGVNFLWIGFLDNVDGSNYGLEVEADYRVSDRLTLFASAGWLNTDVDAITTFDLDLSDFVTHRNTDQAKSPAWQFNGGFNLDITDKLRLRLELEGKDDSRYGYYHDLEIDSYTLVNASLSYQIGNVDLQLWGRNLTDDDYAVHGLYFGNDPRKGWINENYLQLGEPLVVGLTADFHF
jgi:outer membrane receptor protein involved in Fe transport|tara:strand:- start:803 stop:2917 length:2115 start_codon:yes stop_codon:yes gene_type:complete